MIPLVVTQSIDRHSKFVERLCFTCENLLVGSVTVLLTPRKTEILLKIAGATPIIFVVMLQDHLDNLCSQMGRADELAHDYETTRFFKTIVDSCLAPF